RNDIAHTLGNLANVVGDQGDNQRAIQMYREELEMLGERDPLARANTLASLGASHLVVGQLDDSVQAERQALALARTIGNQRLEALALGNLAEALLDKGDLDGTARLRQESLALARKLGDPVTEARARTGLARVD